MMDDRQDPEVDALMTLTPVELRLSERAIAALNQLIEEPPEPTQRLREAVARHREPK